MMLLLVLMADNWINALDRIALQGLILLTTLLSESERVRVVFSLVTTIPVILESHGYHHFTSAVLVE
jgi:hypothetical protein